MKIDPLLEPLSPELPCGPDLKAARDPDFVGVYLASVGRLPTEYIKRGGFGSDARSVKESVFDPNSINFREETRPLDELLVKSRDLRFLVLRAQWSALTGNLAEAADSVEACAALLETHGEKVPPAKADDRKRAFAGLNTMPVFVLPLQFLDLTEANGVTLRKVRVARKETSPLGFEDPDMAAGPMMDALGGKSAEKAVTRSFEAVGRLRSALARIEAACRPAGADKVPEFNNLLPVVDGMLALIREARADLAATAAEAEGPTEVATGEAEVQTAAVADIPGPTVTSHEHARRILEACEAFYGVHEPSSAALLLVTQSRLLIGRPLIEAIETLMPDRVSAAKISFGPSGFLIGIDRLRSLSESVREATGPKAETAPFLVSVKSKAEAKAAIKSVEMFFRQEERSSPIPMLLARARSYIDRDFQSLVDELVPTPKD